MRLLLAAALFALVFAGCATPPQIVSDRDGDGLSDEEEARLGTNPDLFDTDGDGVGDGDEVAAGTDPLSAPKHARVVVAVIDSGINVYHERFQRAGGIPDSVLSTLTLDGKPPERVALATTGDYEERVKKDKQTWNSLKPGVLYHFEGTSILAVSFSAEETTILDDSGHGTMTSGAVLDANPEAIVVLVEGITDAAEAWAAEQPWIDFVSMSYGPPGSVPGSGRLLFDGATYRNTRTMWNAGKVPVGAADNSAALAPTDETAGPPWVVGVAGDHPETACRRHTSGTAPDFTAAFTQQLPTHTSINETRRVSGTSFSTPTVAGSMSLVLLEVRRAWGHTEGIVDNALAVGPEGTLTNAGLRESFNRTATYFPAGACMPPSAPVNPAAPWLQQGWGHIGPELANATLAHILGTTEAPAKPEGARIFMGGVHDVRREFWYRFP
jgi:hypothetical protein